MNASSRTAHRKTLLTLLVLSLLGGSAQVGAWTFVTQPLSVSAAPQAAPAAASKPELVSAVLGFARSTRAGPPRRMLLSAERGAVVKVLTDAKFVALEGNYGPEAEAEGFYSEAMNCTVLLSRSGEMWLTAQKGQPSSDLHYQAVWVDAR